MPFWSDDAAERRRRQTAALERLRTQAEAEASWVVYLPAASWYVNRTVHTQAEWAARGAAQALGLPFVPQIKWFREGAPTDRETDDPLAFRDRPGVGGYVSDADPHTVWLNAAYGQGGEISPPLATTVAHECEHVRQVLAGWRGRDPQRETMARLVAAQLQRGEPVGGGSAPDESSGARGGPFPGRSGSQS